MNLNQFKFQTIFLLCVGVLSASGLLGCGAIRRVRTIPEPAKPLFAETVDAYETRGQAQPVPMDPEEHAVILRKFKGALDPELHGKFHHDPRVDAIAYLRTHAWAHEASAPPGDLVGWAMDKLGVVGDTHDDQAIWASGGRPKNALVTSLIESLAGLEKPEGERYVFGFALVDAGGGKWGLGYVIIEQPVVLKPFKKVYAPGETFRVSGRILGEHRDGYFYMSLPYANDHYEFLALEDKTHLDFEIQLPLEPGRYDVAMSVETKPFETTQAFNVPIYVGVEEPLDPPVEVLNPEENKGDLEEWPRMMLSEINSVRQMRNLPPLKLDEEVGEVVGERMDAVIEDRYKNRPTMGKVFREKELKLYWENLYSPSFEYLAEDKNHLTRYLSNSRDLFSDGYDAAALVFRHAPGDRHASFWSWNYMVMRKYDRFFLEGDTARFLTEDSPVYDDPAIDARLAEHYGTLQPFGAELDSQLQARTQGRMSYRPSLNVLAQIYQERRVLEGRARNWLMSKLGVTGRVYTWFRRWTREEGVSPYTVRRLASYTDGDADERMKHFDVGVYRVPQGDGWYSETYVVVRKTVELEPVAKHYKAGDTIQLSGKFLTEAKSPKVYLGVDEKKVATYKLERNASDRFGLGILAPREPGRYWIQLTERMPAEKAGKAWSYERTVAYFPVYVAAEEPLEIDAHLAVEPTPFAEDSDWVEHIIELFNKERLAYGLAPLKRNPLAGLLMSERIFARRSYWEVGALDVSSEILQKNDAGAIRLSTGESTSWLNDQYWHRILTPANRQRILSEEVQSIGVGLDEDRNFYSVWLLGHKLPKGDKTRAPKNGPEGDQFPPITTLPVDQIEKVLLDNKKPMETCFVKEGLERSRELKGGLTIKFAISAQGTVIGAYPTQRDHWIYDLAQCMVDEIKKLEFPVPTVPGVVFHEQRFVFEPLELGKKAEMTLAELGSEKKEEGEED